MVYAQHVQRKFVTAPGAPLALIRIQEFLVRLRIGRTLQGEVVVALGNIGHDQRRPILPAVVSILHGHRYLQLAHRPLSQHDGGLRLLVDANPLPLQPLCRNAGRGAPAERVQYEVSRLGRRLDDALQQRKRLLRLPPSPLLRMSPNRPDVRNDVLNGNSLPLVHIPLLPRHAAFRRPMNQPGLVEKIEPLLGCEVIQIVPARVRPLEGSPGNRPMPPYSGRIDPPPRPPRIARRRTRSGKGYEAVPTALVFMRVMRV